MKDYESTDKVSSSHELSRGILPLLVQMSAEVDNPKQLCKYYGTYFH